MARSEVLPIPPIHTACDPVDSTRDLRERWRALMGPLGFDTRMLWFGLIGPDRCFTKKLSRVAISSRFRGRIVWNLMSSMRMLLDELETGHTVALLLSGPGCGPPSTTDLLWCRALTDMAERFVIPLEPIFRADDETVAPLEWTENDPVTSRW